MRDRLVLVWRRSQVGGTLGHLWPYMRPDRRILVGVAVTTLVLTAVDIAVPILVGSLIDMLITEANGLPPRDVAGLGRIEIIAVLLGGAFVRSVAIWKQRSLSGRLGQHVAARIRGHLWSHIQTLPLAFTARRGSGRILMRFISDARAIQRFVSRSVVQSVQDGLVIIGVLVVLMMLDWRMGLAVLAIVPMMTMVFHVVNPQIRDASRSTRRYRSRLSAHLNDRLSTLEVVRYRGQPRRDRQRAARLNQNIAESGAKRDAAGGKLLGATAGLTAVATIAALSIASTELRAGNLSTGELITFYALASFLAPILQRVSMNNRTLQEVDISVQRLMQTLAEIPETEADRDRLPLKVPHGHVQVRDLSFAYPGCPRLIDTIEFEARRGEIVVVTGPTGSGKTTLMHLLNRTLEPGSGRIAIDGQDISTVTIGSLREAIGIVGANPPLLDGSVAKNVTHGVRGEPSVMSERRAIEAAGLGGLSRVLPDGWRTRVRSGRRPLSEGERQRVAYAGTLLADAPILLLDQPLAALDDDELRVVMRRLRDIGRGWTIVIVSSRRPILRAADRVYRLADGHLRLIDHGRAAPRFDAGPEETFSDLDVIDLPSFPAGDRSPRLVASGVHRTRDDDREDDDDE